MNPLLLWHPDGRPAHGSAIAAPVHVVVVSYRTPQLLERLEHRGADLVGRLARERGEGVFRGKPERHQRACCKHRRTPAKGPRHKDDAEPLKSIFASALDDRRSRSRRRGRVI